MMTHVNVTAGNTENGTSLLRRFTKSVRGTGIVMTVKGKRYYSRSISPFKKRSKALRRIDNINKYENLIKLGKIEPRGQRAFSTTSNSNDKK